MSRNLGQPNGVVTLRQVSNRNTTLLFSIPSSIGRLLRDAGKVGGTYTVELTEDGVLFRPLAPAGAPDLPAWMQEEAKA